MLRTPLSGSIGVLLVEDRAGQRAELSALVGNMSGIELLGVSRAGDDAREAIACLCPDLLIVGIEPPVLNTLQFVGRFLSERFSPVIIVSDMEPAEVDRRLQWMKLPPIPFYDRSMVVSDPSMLQRAIARASRQSASLPKPVSGVSGREATAIEAPARTPGFAGAAQTVADWPLLAIGSSEGGLDALTSLVPKLRPDGPPVLVAQHIPAGYSASFARRLDALAPQTVLEAKDAAIVLPGHVYIAPGGKHMTVSRAAAGAYRIQLLNTERVSNHRPSVDVLFESVAKHSRGRSVGVVLTGMGSDGAAGLLAMHQSGSKTLIQDKSSSLVWGMPGSALKLCAAHVQHPLDAMPERICAALMTFSSPAVATL